MNRSVVRMQQRELDSCIADLRRAVAVYEANDDEEPLAEARHNLGYAALLGGDLVTALTLMTRSRPKLAAISDLAAAISDLDRAEVLRDAGLTTEAEALLEQVATQFGAQGCGRPEASPSSTSPARSCATIPPPPSAQPAPRRDGSRHSRTTGGRREPRRCVSRRSSGRDRTAPSTKQNSPAQRKPWTGEVFAPRRQDCD